MTDDKPTESDSDAQKRKFREALDKKKAKNIPTESHKGGSKVDSAHGPAAHAPMFRRKSI
ncbi:DUF5302 domain-containing protein [Actinomycetes bacterium M1A6_2h]